MDGRVRLQDEAGRGHGPGPVRQGPGHRGRWRHPGRGRDARPGQRPPVLAGPAVGRRPGEVPAPGRGAARQLFAHPLRPGVAHRGRPTAGRDPGPGEAGGGLRPEAGGAAPRPDRGGSEGPRPREVDLRPGPVRVRHEPPAAGGRRVVEQPEPGRPGRSRRAGAAGRGRGRQAAGGPVRVRLPQHHPVVLPVVRRLRRVRPGVRRAGQPRGGGPVPEPGAAGTRTRTPAAPSTWPASTGRPSRTPSPPRSRRAPGRSAARSERPSTSPPSTTPPRSRRRTTCSGGRRRPRTCTSGTTRTGC